MARPIPLIAALLSVCAVSAIYLLVSGQDAPADRPIDPAEGSAGGTSAGGTSASGTSASGTSAGGTSAGGTSASGTGASGTGARRTERHAVLSTTPGPYGVVSVYCDEMTDGLRNTVVVRRVRRPEFIRGVYMTSWSLTSSKRTKYMLDLIDSTELNAVVIDVKDVTGVPAFDIEANSSAGTPKIPGRVKDFDDKLNTFIQKGIYAIARIAVFNDQYMPNVRPDLAVHTGGGNVWKDGDGYSWLKQDDRRVWDYIVGIARLAAMKGFDEIQFDYIRFPDKRAGSEWFESFSTEQARVDTIVGFLKYAKRCLEPYKVKVSADVFGLVCSATSDIGIGQRLEDLAEVVDIISPMVYPSHYAPGSYGLSLPEKEPGATVRRSLADAAKRLGIRAPQTVPWLQDFSLRVAYSADSVKEQIAAAEDLADGWLLWSPSNVYTSPAVEGANGLSDGALPVDLVTIRATQDGWMGVSLAIDSMQFSGQLKVESPILTAPRAR